MPRQKKVYILEDCTSYLLDFSLARFDQIISAAEDGHDLGF